MLFFNFKNYEEFNEIFGIIEHGNGVKSRKNKILLALYKDRNFFKKFIAYKEYCALNVQCNHFNLRYSRQNANNGKHFKRTDTICCALSKKLRMLEEERVNNYDLLEYVTLPTLKTRLYNILGYPWLSKKDVHYQLVLNGRIYMSDSFHTDDMEGLCEDGTMNAIRYCNVEKRHVFKMKAGKMFNHILSYNMITDELPEQIKRWLSEEFVAEWNDYTRERLGNSDYVLHVDDNFADIYSRNRCAEYNDNPDSFGSCMQGDGQWVFYRDSVKAKAAYLTDRDGMIVARCIIFTHVEDEDGKKWRLAERQYSCGCDDVLKRQLVIALIKGGHIDGYKKVGTSCHDSRGFVDNEGNSLEYKHFRISCNLEPGDILSYQDSFKYYDLSDHIAYNRDEGCEYQLDTTDKYFEENDCDDHENDNWSEYNSEYIDEYDSSYVDTRDDYFYNSQCVTAQVYNRHNGRFYDENCFEGDCICINNEYFYAGRNANSPEEFGIYSCPSCGEWFVPEYSSSYSEVTENDYCCDDCREEDEERWCKANGYAYSDYDDRWYPEKEIVTVKEWGLLVGRYYESTISVSDFESLAERGEAVKYNGEFYIDSVDDGKPVHLIVEQVSVA